MASQIMFFTKNVADYSNTNASATASQGSDFASYVMNRSNASAWVTSGSVDADNTTLTIDFGDLRYFDSLLLILQNFKNYSAQYWDGSAWTNFSPAISVTNNTADSKYHTFTEVFGSKVRVTITGTMVADSDKYLYQLIATSLLGQLNGWPVIKNPKHVRIRTKTQMLSGKLNVTESVGAFQFGLSVPNWSDSDDLDLVEYLYTLSEGFHVWLCGDDEAQFSSPRKGYRKEDIYLCRMVNDYEPEFANGFYKSGLKLDLLISEVVG